MRRTFALAAFTALMLVGLPTALQAAAVTGFSYQMPKLSAPDPGLTRYLQQDRAKLYREYAALFIDPDFADQDFSSFEQATSWTVDSAAPGLVVLVGGQSSYTGGAHGYAFLRALIWDKARGAAIPFAGLFSNATAVRSLLTASYCRALDKERFVRRGEPTPVDDMFGGCPDLLKDATVYPTKLVYGKYSRIAINLAPYAAGPYAEGSYDLEIVIPKGLKQLAKPQYQALFPG